MTSPLRQDSFYVVLPILMGAIGSSLIGISEFMESGDPWGTTHLAHYRLNFGLFLAAIVTLMHMMRLLPGNVWGLVLGHCWIVLGIYMTSHHQHNLALTLTHQFSAAIFIFVGLSSMAEYLVALYYTKCSDLSVSEQERSDNFTKSTGIFYSYGNLAQFCTPAPMLHSYAAWISGVWWMYMAFVFYASGDDGSGWDQEILNDDMQGRMIVMDMLYNTLLFTAAALVVSSLALKYVDNLYFRGAKSEKSLSL